MKTLAWARDYDLRDSPSGPGLLVVLAVDLIDQSRIDEGFQQVAEKIARAEREKPLRYGANLFYSILAFGTEPSELRTESVHAAYNRMWHGNWHLWETIQSRRFPMALWLIDNAGRPYHVIIQPAKHGDFEAWRDHDLRETEFFRAYESDDEAGWLVVLPVNDRILPSALAHIRTQRFAAPGAAADQPRE